MKHSDVKVSFNYAKAWLSMAYDPEVAENFYKDCLFWKNIFKVAPVINFIFTSPICSEEKKKNLFDTFSSNNKISDISKSVFYLLNKNKKAGIWNSVIDSFIKLYLKKKKICSTTVTTSIILDEELTKKMEEVIKHIFDCEGAIVDNVIDEKIIAGFILRTDTLHYDRSISSALKKLRKNITNI